MTIYNLYAEHPRLAPDGGELVHEYVREEDIDWLIAEYRLTYGHGWLVFAQERPADVYVSKYPNTPF